MLRTDLIRNVGPGPSGTTTGKIYLTFDLDWCSDSVLRHTLDLIERRDVHATFFVTHRTPLLDRIRENPKFELGIHPNFNCLLEGDFRYGRTYRSVIEHFLSLVPDAVSVRSHSLVQSSGILKAFFELGITHDCNLLVPATARPEPFLHWQNGLLRVPFVFEDDVECQSAWSNLGLLRTILSGDFLKVLDWHPIHIFLNTEDLTRYESARPVLQEHALLARKVNANSYGANDFLHEILGQCS